jgi:hypothetical protein
MEPNRCSGITLFHWGNFWQKSKNDCTVPTTPNHPGDLNLEKDFLSFFGTENYYGGVEFEPISTGELAGSFLDYLVGSLLGLKNIGGKDSEPISIFFTLISQKNFEHPSDPRRLFCFNQLGLDGKTSLTV